MTDAEWRSWLLELLADDHGPAREIVAAAPGPHRLGYLRYAHRSALAPRADDRHRRRGTRHRAIGRAGSGHGTRGRGDLAQCVRDLPDVPTAFVTFERFRRARVEKVVKHGARSSNSKAAGPIGRVIRDALLPLVFHRAAKDGGAALRWMTGHHIDWDTPVLRHAPPFGRALGVTGLTCARGRASGL